MQLGMDGTFDWGGGLHCDLASRPLVELMQMTWKYDAGKVIMRLKQLLDEAANMRLFWLGGRSMAFPVVTYRRGSRKM